MLRPLWNSGRFVGLLQIIPMVAYEVELSKMRNYKKKKKNVYFATSTLTRSFSFANTIFDFTGSYSTTIFERCGGVISLRWVHEKAFVVWSVRTDLSILLTCANRSLSCLVHGTRCTGGILSLPVGFITNCQPIYCTVCRNPMKVSPMTSHGMAHACRYRTIRKKLEMLWDNILLCQHKPVFN